MPANDAWVFDLKQEAKARISFGPRHGSEEYVSTLEDLDLIARRKWSAAEFKFKCLKGLIDMRKGLLEAIGPRHIEF